MRSTRLLAPLTVASSLLVASSASAAEGCSATFSVLQVLGNSNESFAYGVSPDGSVAVGRNSLTGPACQGNCQAWRWSITGPGGSIVPPATNGEAVASSLGGALIVGNPLFGNIPFRWDPVNGYALLSLPAGAISGSVADISSDGTTVVGRANFATGEKPMLIVAGTPSLLPTLPGDIAAEAKGISLDGSTIVGVSRTGSGLSSYSPVRWSQGAALGLGPLPPNYSWAVAEVASSDGSVIAGSLEGFKGFFRWTQATGIVKLPVHSGSVTGVSGDGSIVIGMGQLVPNGPTAAIIWDAEHGARFLQDALANEWGVATPGWSFTTVEDISADGRTLVGFGWDPSNRRRAWSIVREAPPFADLTGDCRIEGADLAILLRAWGLPSGPADLDGNGIVDGADLTLLLGAWAP